VILTLRRDEPAQHVMAITATLRVPATLPDRLLRIALFALVSALLVAISLPVILAEPGPLSSDESLYVAEGLNLAEGKGFSYTTGEAVHHRGPVYPALLAADFSIAGFSLDHARWVPKLFLLGNALLLFALGWRLFGKQTAILAAAIGLTSSFVTVLGGTLFLDGVQTFFLLAMLLALHQALRSGSARWATAAGVTFGLAVLTKESALLWAPLPYLAVLLLGRAVDKPGRLLIAYALAAIATAGWWWIYVYVVTGRVYLLGPPGSGALWLAGGLLVLMLSALAAQQLAARDRSRLTPSMRWAAVAIPLAAWGAIFLVGLEAHATWPFGNAYLSNVSDYTTGVLAAWLRPLPVVGAAWGYAAYRAWRGALGDRLLVLGLLLFLPFALFAANRDLSARDLLPVIYLSYLVLARAAIDAARWLASALGESLNPAVGSAIALALLVAAFSWYSFAERDRVEGYRAAFDPQEVRQDNWDNPLARDVAVWIEARVPEGTPIMSSRLYYSHLYALTGAEYPWWQLPTVRVDFGGEPVAPVRASTLFRWEDHQMPAGQADPWLFLRRYPVKHYYVALSERDLIASIAENEVEYVILTGDDAGFSSLSLLAYFDGHPSFRRVATFAPDERNQAHIFQVDHDRLVVTGRPALVSEPTVQALRRRLGSDQAEAMLEALSPAGYTITPSYGAPAGAEALPSASEP
jgi:4-amino-4-deoxy-L-arabinose transferase-like glycosyltransferase